MTPAASRPLRGAAPRRRPAWPSHGFTLIEMLVTLAILGVLASVAVPLAETTVRRAHETELRQALRDVRRAIDAYKAAVDDGRIARDAGASGYPKNLQLLVDGVPDQRGAGRARQIFLRRLPADPMAAQRSDGAPVWGLRSYASDADNPQEGDDVFDIYSTSTGTGLNGTAYRQW